MFLNLFILILSMLKEFENQFQVKKVNKYMHCNLVDDSDDFETSIMTQNKESVQIICVKQMAY